MRVDIDALRSSSGKHTALAAQADSLQHAVEAAGKEVSAAVKDVAVSEPAWLAIDAACARLKLISTGLRTSGSAIQAAADGYEDTDASSGSSGSFLAGRLGGRA